MKLISIVISLALATSIHSEPIDLAGTWKFHLPGADQAEIEDPSSVEFGDTIQLPGMLTAQGFGDRPSMSTKWAGGGWIHPAMFREYQADDNFKFPFFLQPPLYHVGAAWYQRRIEIPAAWQGDSVLLHLERPHWYSSVWLDGRKAGGGEALGTPHEIDLGALAPGAHTLTLRIDNRFSPVNPGESAHSVTDHTQGNWNGVAGKIELRRQPPDHITNIQMHPSMDGGMRVIVSGKMRANLNEATVQVWVRPKGQGGGEAILKSRPLESRADGSFQVELTGHLDGNVKIWDEFEPNLYVAEAGLYTGDVTPAHSKTVSFGFREVVSKDGAFWLNRRPLWLRGTLDCAIFPRTGHPPTDVESWRKIMRACREHGLNHIRFHSWCPPEAAFAAADEAGIYFQVEASAWSGGEALLGNGLPLDAWLDREMERMVREYGNHPSFLLLAHGNEPHGPNHVKWLRDFVSRWKAKEPRILHTTGSGWPLAPGSDFHSTPRPRLQQWGEGMKSRINALPPSTDFDWSQFVQNHTDAPVVAHENGQWCAYPDFRMIAKCDGFFKAKNYEVFRSLAEKHGLLGKAERFLHDSGRLQVLAYKHDIESVLRTPGLGGFQLLGIQDFSGQGTALVGVVDFFWDSKSYVTAQEFRRFCGPVVPLARLPKMVFTTDETLRADLQLYQFSNRAFMGMKPTWTLKHGDETIASGELPARDLAPFKLHGLGSIEVSLSNVKAPAKLTLTLGAAGESFSNHWDLFVYPPKLADVPAGEGTVTRDWEVAAAALKDGRKIFWMPPADSIADDPEHPLQMGFSPIFWNTAYTKWQPPHTLGMSVDPSHPAFADFPTDSHSNWQWWEIQHGGRPFILTAHPEIEPVAEVIDDWFTARRLGLVFEAQVGNGKLLACGADLSGDLNDRPAARQFRASLMRYFASDRFAPSTALAIEDLRNLLKRPPLAVRLGMKATAASAESGFPATAVLDGKPGSIWHTEFSARKPQPPHDLTLAFPEETPVRALLITQRQDGSPNGQVDDVEILDASGKSLARARIPKNATSQLIPLPADTRLSRFTLRVHSTHAGIFASIAELDVLQD